MTKEALKLALEALTLTWANKEINGWRDDAYGYEPEDYPEIMSAITAVKEALAQPAPVPCCGKYETCTQACTPRGKFLGAREAAAQRKPLTDEQIRQIMKSLGWTGEHHDDLAFARAIEAAHGIKENT